MVDVTGSRNGINNVTHGKTVVSCDTVVAASFTQRNPKSPFGVAKTTLNGGLVPYYLDMRMGSPHASVPDGSSVALARVPNMSQELLSGLNSLYELKDCKAFLDLLPVHFLWAAARRKRAESVRALHKWLSEIKTTAQSPLALLQALAGADLMWKFGVAPLVRDVHSVHVALSQLQAKVQELVSKPITVAGKYTTTGESNYSNVSGNSNDTCGYYHRAISTHAKTTKTWVYGVRKRFDGSKIPSVDVVQLKSLAESLGLSLDATDLWEAIPYSFVVDWFLPIQTMLESFSQAKPDPSWLLTEAAWTSTKTVTQGRVQEVITPLSTANCVVDAFAGVNRFGTFTRTDYTRTRLPSLPTWNPTIYIPRPQWPSLAQGITGMELLIVRIKRTLK